MNWIGYDELKPYGFIPGEYEMVCRGCGQKWALMAATATHCKRCAKTALKKASEGPYGPDSNENS